MSKLTSVLSVIPAHSKNSINKKVLSVLALRLFEGDKARLLKYGTTKTQNSI